MASTSGADLVRRYFKQLTEGCGKPGCPNRHCFSCVDGPSPLDRTAAALKSLELARAACIMSSCAMSSRLSSTSSF